MHFARKHAIIEKTRKDGGKTLQTKGEQDEQQMQRLQRLNELANKARAGEKLSEQELEEQKLLREEYRLAFRAAFRGMLENTYVQQPDGSRRKLTRKDQ